MTDTTASKNTVASGSFNTQQSHDIKSGLLEAAIADYEAIATTFAANAISDDKCWRAAKFDPPFSSKFDPPRDSVIHLPRCG